MGNPCALSYANLFLGRWEETIIFKDDQHPLFMKVGLWVQYIDDIFIIWNGSREEFCNLMDLININEIGLKFTFEIQEELLPFLDVLIQKTQNGDISTTVFRKPTATNSLLRWESDHPVPLKKGIPQGQFLRLQRNCSTIETFKKEARDLRKRFLERGYPT